MGAATETITATAEAPLVKVDTSELGQVIQSKEIDELPLNSQTGRNFTALMTLVPGASGPTRWACSMRRRAIRASP